MIIIAIAFGLLTILLTSRKYRGFFNPITLIFTYFYVTLVLSMLSLTGINKPSDIGVASFLTVFVSAAIGSLLARGGNNKGNDGTIIFNYSLLRNFVICFAFIPMAYMFIRGVGSIAGDYTSYVANVRFDDNAVSVAGSSFMSSFVERIVRPISIVAVLIGLALYFHGEKKGVFYIGLLSSLFYSILYIKRIDLSVLFILYVVAAIATAGFNNKRSKLVRNFAISALVGGGLLIISSFRASEFSFYELLMHYGLGYHTYGYLLFDSAINNQGSHIHDLVVPGSTIFASFDFLFSQISRPLGYDYIPTSSYLYAEEWGNYVFMGYYDFNSAEVSPNAFYTNLYPLYRDFRFFGLAAIPFLYGYLFSRNYLNYVLYKNISSLVWVLFFVYVGYFSTLTPIISSNIFWYIPIIIYIFTRFKIKR